MTVLDVEAWLAALGLDRYVEIFRAADIDGEVLADLSEADLAQLGVTLGHRKRIIKAIGLIARDAKPSDEARARPGAEGERRQITVVVADIVGSTALASRLDPEVMRLVLRAYQDAVSSVIARYDGFLARFMGDGVYAYFGFPRAHEDDAERAVRAALEIAVAVSALQTPSDAALAVRVGVATGLVIASEIVGDSPGREQEVIGDPLGVAARLQAVAKPGEVVIGPLTQKLVGDRFELEPLGRRLLKGLMQPIEMWTALGVAPRDSRFAGDLGTLTTGFVGRQTETAALLALRRRAWSGHGATALISGEAGIGKSRLAEWLARRTGGEAHLTLRYQCSPYHRESVLFPFGRQLERAAQIRPLDEAVVKLDKIERLLGLITNQLGEVVPLFASHLSIPFGDRYPAITLTPPQQRRRTFELMVEQIELLARRHPVLLLFEDAHWADPTSIEALGLMIERLRTLSVLLVVTYRPDFEPPWRHEPGVSTIPLGRLDSSEVHAMIGRVAAGREMPADVIAEIVAKTDGVPLFVEELTKSVLESGDWVEEGGGFRLIGSAPQFAIPSTLRDSLMARLDRLNTVKEIAQIGSAIGRDFSYALLACVVECDEASLRRALTQLVDSGLVFAFGDPPEARYSFKHALVQDAAYESMLKSRRATLHRRIADALRDRFPDRAANEPELVAQHFARAGLIDSSAVYWGKAGERALRRSAFDEAIAHFGRAIEAADVAAAAGEARLADPQALLRWRLALGTALSHARGYHSLDSKAAFQRAREMIADIGDPDQRFVTCWGLWTGFYLRNEADAMREIADFLLRDAEALENPGYVCLAQRLAGITAWSLDGDYLAARAHLEAAVALYDPARDAELGVRFGQDIGVAAMIYLAIVLWPLGEHAAARRWIDAALSRARNSDHVPTLAFTGYMVSLFEMRRGSPQAALPHARAVMALAREHGLGFFLLNGAIVGEWAETLIHRNLESLAALERANAAVEAQGLRAGKAYSNVALAEALIACDRLDEAVEAAQRAVDCVRDEQLRAFEADAHFALGQALQRRRPEQPGLAAAAFGASLEVAKARRARSYELRAALALARLSGLSRENRRALSDAVAGFEATPECPDVAEARALLAG